METGVAGGGVGVVGATVPQPGDPTRRKHRNDSPAFIPLDEEGGGTNLPAQPVSGVTASSPLKSRELQAMRHIADEQVTTNKTKRCESFLTRRNTSPTPQPSLHNNSHDCFIQF